MMAVQAAPDASQGDQTGHRAVRRVLLCVPLGSALSSGRAAEPAEAPLRFGFSSQALKEINESDMKAAFKVWAITLSADQNLPFDPEVSILAGLEAIKQALTLREVESVILTAREFWALSDTIPVGPIILGHVNGTTTEEYLLLVHRDNQATGPADLQGQTVHMLDHPRASLPPVWLDTLLLEATQREAFSWLGPITYTSKLSRVVLPVFFRQATACVVTRNGYRTMTELNPQVGQQLRILAQSDAFVPTLYMFRSGLDSPQAKRMIADISKIALLPAGQQALALFQTDGLVVAPLSDMDATCALLDRHQRLLAAALGSTSSRQNPERSTP